MNQEIVNLRRIEKEDIVLLYKWSRNQELGFFNAFANNISMIELEKQYDAKLADNSILDYLILLGEEENPVGFCGIKDINWIDRSGEMFVSVCEKDAREKGVAYSALLHLAVIAFYEMNLNRVFGKVASNNKRSGNLMEQCGLVRQGTLREAHYHHDHYYDVHIYGLLKKEATPLLSFALSKVVSHYSSGCTDEALEKMKTVINKIGDNAEMTLGAF